MSPQTKILMGLLIDEIFGNLTRLKERASNLDLQEYAPRGEMYKTLNKQPKGRFDESTTGKYIYQMANALSYCHSKKVRIE